MAVGFATGVAVEPASAVRATPRAALLETKLLGRFSLVHLQIEKGNSKVHLHARVPGLSYLKPQTKIGIEVDSVQSYIFPV